MSPDRLTTSSAELVVFSIIRASSCSECGGSLPAGSWLRLEGEDPLCLPCADLEHLVFLPTGNAALTRRAKRYSAVHAAVVRFARARKRYERQGLLIEEAALVRAEQECELDGPAREAARARAAERRAAVDDQYVAQFAASVGKVYPGCDASECAAIARHACLKYSGRVGRTAAAKRLDREAIDLAVRAHVRHAHTRYDELLALGWDRHAARASVGAAVDRTLQAWGVGPDA